MTYVWGWTTTAFTWYVFVGAASTAIVALLVQSAKGRAPAPQ